MLTRRQLSILLLVGCGGTLFFLVVLRPVSDRDNAVTTSGSRIYEHLVESLRPWRALDAYFSADALSPPGYIKSSTPTRPITETTLLLSPSGFTVYDNLYLRNGTIYAVTSEPNRASYPPLKHIIAKGISTDWGLNLDPTDEEMQIISLEEAEAVLGTGQEEATVIDGMSFILYDSTQFMLHYYHWWGEIILGALRVYETLSLLPDSKMKKPLGEVKRWLLPVCSLSRYFLLIPHLVQNVVDHSWRDYSGMDGPLMRAAFPSAAIERNDYWDDLKSLSERTWVFERAMIVSREAAHKQ